VSTVLLFLLLIFSKKRIFINSCIVRSLNLILALSLGFTVFYHYVPLRNCYCCHSLVQNNVDYVVEFVTEILRELTVNCRQNYCHGKLVVAIFTFVATPMFGRLPLILCHIF